MYTACVSVKMSGVALLQIHSLAEERLSSLNECNTSAGAAAECHLSAVYQPTVRLACEPTNKHNCAAHRYH